MWLLDLYMATCVQMHSCMYGIVLYILYELQKFYILYNQNNNFTKTLLTYNKSCWQKKKKEEVEQFWKLRINSSNDNI